MHKHAYLSVGEAAELLGISTDTLRRWEKAGRIQSCRTPTNHRRFNRAKVEELLTSTPTPAPASKAVAS
ncbi:MerR family transcriptional regulator [Mycobacteroides abscessus]|uniref:MerR family transcriptional regulator n=1 Tax=Mycobacteroides abscessus TaxID=36809 RepID=UPI000925BB19|nr:helix-turn-helix domain-containing protein [Mycobacteroides abscessus]SLC82605.1 DNA binding domain, excisionase family [Mycobacteroides abscessus subsp. massiliense]MBN7389383.1 helix-turn-helix domain-containing protein [Mycobacteroides abscessus subsp. abscessus]MBN7419194.1 helix-turn-helix domain-containing protein [Mycobacteroides abscessus subsp. abscessus]MDM2331262.1 helix-turn-helix domain-containing protein [Mycobacteroides abscessus]MDM2336320.1 helix-turn-helix domain-containin